MTIFGGDSERYEAILYADIAEWVRAMAEAKSSERSLTDTVEKDSLKQTAALKLTAEVSKSTARDFSEASRKQRDASNDTTRTIEANSIKQRLAMDSVGRSSKGMRIGLAGLIAAATPAVPVLSALGGVVAGLPAIFGAAGLAVGNFKSLGLGDISKAAATIETTQQKLAAGTIKQAAANKAITNATLGLSTAQKAALPVFSAWSDTMQGVADVSQRKILPAIGGLGAAVKANMGTIQSAMSSSAGSIAGAIKGLTGFAQTPLFKAEFGTLMKSSASSLGQFFQIAGGAGRSFLAIGAAAAPFVHSLGEMTKGITGTFAAWSESKGGQHDIQGFLSATSQSLRIVGMTFKELGRILIGVFAPGFESSKLLVKSLNEVLAKVGDFLNSTRGKADVQQFWHVVAQAILAVGKAIGDMLPTALSIGKVIYGVASAFEHLVGSGTAAKIGLIGFALLKIPIAGKIASAGLSLLFASPLLGGLAITAGALFLLSRQASGIGAAADSAAAKLAHLYDVKNHSTGTALDVAQAQLDRSSTLGTSGSAHAAEAAAKAKLSSLQQSGTATPQQIARQEALVAAATKTSEQAYINAARARLRYTEAQEAAKKGDQERIKAAKDLGKSLNDLVTESKSAFAIPTGRSPNGPVTPPDTSSRTIGAAADAFNSAAQKSNDLTAAGKRTAAQLAGVIRQAKTINDARIIAHIGARDIGAGKTIEDVTRRARALGLLKPKPTIDANTNPIVAAINRTNTLIAKLVSPKKVTVSPSGFNAVNTAIDGVNRNILHLTSTPFTVKVNYATGNLPPSPTGPPYKKRAMGGRLDGPTFIAGEEAPQHPEWVIATNPAYRSDNVGYLASAASALGMKITPRKKGGPLSSRLPSSRLTEGSSGHADPSTTAAGIQNLNGTIETLVKKLAKEQADVFKKQGQVRELADEKRNLKHKTPPVAPTGGRKHNAAAYAKYDRERADYRKFENDRKGHEKKLSQDESDLHKKIAAEQYQMRKDRHQLAGAKADLRKLKKTTSSAPNFAAFDSQYTSLLDALGEQTSVLGADGNLATGSPQTLGQIVALLDRRVRTLKGYLGDKKYKPFVTAIQDELRTDEQNLGQYRKQQFDATATPAFDLNALLDAGGFTRALAEADLTSDNADDIAALGSEKSFLESLLGNPAIAGSNADYVTVATAVKSVNDQLASFAAAGPTADQSAQIQQLQQQLAIQTRTTGLSDAALRVFGGSGDIGSGGYGNAFSSAQGSGPTIVIQTLHPGDPDTLAAVAEAANAGNGLQTSIPSSRQTVNI